MFHLDDNETSTECRVSMLFATIHNPCIKNQLIKKYIRSCATFMTIHEQKKFYKKLSIIILYVHLTQEKMREYSQFLFVSP